MRDFDLFCDAIATGQTKKVAKYLRARAYDYEYLNKSVAIAARYGHAQIMQMLCVHPWFEATWRENIALTTASEHGHIECVRLLLDNGAHASGEHNQAMWEASAHRHIAIMQLLLPSWKGSVDKTTLINMGQYGYEEEMMLLWSQSPNHLKARAFMNAAINGHVKLVTHLLQWVVFSQEEEDNTRVFVDLADYKHNKIMYENVLRQAISAHTHTTLSGVVDVENNIPKKKSKI